MKQSEFPKGWTISKLSKYIVQYKEKTTVNNQYPVLTSSREGIMFQKDYFANREVASQVNIGYNIVPKGYFTYRHMSDDFVFKFNINDLVDFGIVSTLYPVFNVKGVNKYFLKYYLNNSTEFQKYSRYHKQGGSRTYMYLEKLKQMEVCFPPVKEQDIIAGILMIWDEEINKLSELINFEKTKQKEMINNIYRGKYYTRVDLNEKFSKLKNYITEVSTKNNILLDNVLSVSNSKGFIPQDEQFDREVASKDKSKYKVIMRNEFAYNPSRINVGSIDQLLTQDCGILSPMYTVFKCNNNLNNRYLYHYLKSDLFLSTIPKFTQGSVRDSLSFDTLSSFKIFVPSVENQIDYAKLLDTVNEYIAKLECLLDLYKRQQKGLMQQLLTGKIRVNVN